MALQKWECTNCGKSFKVGEWRCADGSNHVVAAKTFLCLDAPVDPGKFIGSPPIVRGRTMVCGIPPAHKETEGLDTKWVGEGTVEFINGRYTTTDPEQQYYLEKKGKPYNATEEEWQSVWWTKEESLAQRELNIKAQEQRLENDRNTLLESTKAKVRGGGDLQSVRV